MVLNIKYKQFTLFQINLSSLNKYYLFNELNLIILIRIPFIIISYKWLYFKYIFQTVHFLNMLLLIATDLANG